MKKLITILTLILFTSQVNAGTYYSKASGDWNDVNTWGTACGSGGGSIPGTGDNAVICSGYTVTTTTNIICKTLTVTGTLDCNAGTVLSPTLATTVVGTMNQNNGTFNASQVFTVVGSFNFVAGNFNSSDDFDVYGVYSMSGGVFSTDKAFNVESTGVATISGGTFSLTGGNNDNLEVDGILNLSGGTIDVNNDTEIQFGGVLNVSGTADYTAQGDFRLVYGAGGTVNMSGGNMTFMADFYSNIPNNDFIQTAGTITFKGAGSEWRMKALYSGTGSAHAIFDGDTELYQLASGEYHFYDLTINAGKTLDQNNADTISVAHNWTNNTGTYTHNSNAVIFDGIEDQSIGGTSATTFYDIVIRNTGASGTDNITLNQPTTVSNTVMFDDGIVVSTATNILTVTNNSNTASNGGNAGSFVSGPMSWDLTTGGTYEFPTGKAPTRWARAALSDLTGSTYFTCEYFKAGYSNTDSLVAPVDKVSVVEYWEISEVDPSVDAAVTIYWEDADYSGITNCTPGGDLIVGHFNGSKWEDIGNGGGTTGTCAGPTSFGTVKSDLQTSFSPFTFGSHGINPLPIELLEFNATQKDNLIELSWSTATEINNDYFTLEKTVDGVNFETVEVIQGAGNSTSILNYYTVDYNPYNKVSYYRLKQTDYNGNYSYSELEMVVFEEVDNFSFELYPNPNDGESFHLAIDTDKSEMVLVVVHDILGKKMFSQVLITSQNGNNVYAMDPSKKLSSGVYTITATSNHKIYNKRLVVSH